MTVLEAKAKGWESRLYSAFQQRVRGAGGKTIWPMPFVIGPCINGDGSAVLVLDGFDLHELYSVFVDSSGPEGCCAGYARLPLGWCESCDRERDAEKAPPSIDVPPATLAGTRGATVAKDNLGKAIDFFWGVDILYGDVDDDAEGPFCVEAYNGPRTRDALLAALRKRRKARGWAFAVPRGEKHFESRKRYSL